MRALTIGSVIAVKFYRLQHPWFLGVISAVLKSFRCFPRVHQRILLRFREPLKPGWFAHRESPYDNSFFVLFYMFSHFGHFFAHPADEYG
jgi:hypothetical protein